MDTLVVVVMGLIAVAALGAAGWLAFDRSRLMSLLATTSSSRDEIARLAEERERDLNESERKLDETSDALDALQVEAAKLKERFDAREREYKQAINDVEHRYKERAEREEKHLRDVARQMHDAFEMLASKALDKNAERFLRLASENMDKQRERAGSEFEKRQKAIADLVMPIRETLTKTDEKLVALEKTRTETHASLSQRILHLDEQTRSLTKETGRLVQSLKSPQVRGRWGELTLRRVVELAGMSAHCDFDTQTTTNTGDAKGLRPDMIVQMPGGRTIVVDAKAPLQAYIEAMEASTEEQRAERIVAHARQLRQRIEELAGKAYHSALAETPEFTVLFVPGDHFLSAALMEQPDLLEHAAGRNVIITTPATLIALLKAVHFGWAQASLADDAREILRLGRDLHDRVSVMTDHLTGIGTNLRRSVEAYNKAVGSWEARVLPSARRMADHNIRSPKELPTPDPVTVAPRTPTELDDPDDTRAQRQLELGTRPARPADGAAKPKARKDT